MIPHQPPEYLPVGIGRINSRIRVVQNNLKGRSGDDALSGKDSQSGGFQSKNRGVRGGPASPQQEMRWQKEKRSAGIFEENAAAMKSRTRVPGNLKSRSD